jgi:NhaP-type Na+/H+ or K+/H+ antiporter/Trk K+ transport system NAD-binding subunit
VHSVDYALLTIAWAAAAGMLAQVVGHRLKIPAIVPLLAVGLALGPSGLGVVRPSSLGDGLSVIVKLSVAVILFEGALSLRVRDLQAAKLEVRNLVTTGVVVTWLGATLVAWRIADFSFPVAVVFGALVTVTGPTVVQPLLRRVPLPRRVKTILEGEAILIDPIGAVLAVGVVDVVLGMAGVRTTGVLAGVLGYIGRLVVGAAVGSAGAVVLSWVLKRRAFVPTALSNLVSLAIIWAAFGASEWLLSESGIMAAVAMGLVVQRGAIPEERRLRLFKEQLTVLAISLLFVLLAANLPVHALVAEGWRGIIAVLVLMWVVRPVSVALSLARTATTIRERLYIAWIGPRGIVAASVASLFALVLTEAGFPEGERVLAVTFLTIAMTVTIQGLTAGLMARLLGLQSLTGRGVIVIGAGPLGVMIARTLADHGRPVVVVDRNTMLVGQAIALGLDAREGNALDESVLEAAGADEAETIVAVTTNSEVNALATHLAHDAFAVSRAIPALGRPEKGAGPRLLERVGGHIAFGRPINVRSWEDAIERGAARLVVYSLPAAAGKSVQPATLPDDVIAFARMRGQSIEVTTADQSWAPSDVLMLVSRLSEAETVTALGAIVPGPVPEVA